MDLGKIIYHNLLQKPVLDRIFYVPFWDCPYMCDFCCVASVPGKPKENFQESAEALFSLLSEMYESQKEPIQVHVYGGEPLLRADFLLSLGLRLQETGWMKKFYLYSTLRPPGLDRIVEGIGRKNIRVIVNPDTANPRVLEQMKKYPDVTEFYKNQVFFPTGRARVGEASYRKTIWERILPMGLPGKACFANASGPLVNGEHGTIHLCCLPQSPVIGRLGEDPAIIWKRYQKTLSEFYKKVHSLAKEKGYSFPCSVCEELSRWNPKVPPDTSHLSVMSVC